MQIMPPTITSGRLVVWHRSQNSKLLDMMESHGCDYVDVPGSDLQFAALDSGDASGVTDMGGYFRVEFQSEEFKQRASKNIPFLPNLDELKLGFAEWLRDNKPQALECKVERLLRESGHDILWTKGRYLPRRHLGRQISYY